MAHEIPEKDLKWFREKGILVKKVAPLVKKTEIGEYPPIVFDKLYVFGTFFKKWEKVVFLDSDIIVRGPLNKLTKVKTFASVNVLNLKLKQYFSKVSEKDYKKIKKKINLEKNLLTQESWLSIQK